MNTAYIISFIKGIILSLELFVKTLEGDKPAEESVPKDVLLNSFAMAIQKFEGYVVNPPSRSFRNRNPGNARYSSVGYLGKYGKVGKDKDNFAIFESYEIGFLYLKNLILEKARKNPTWDLYKFFDVYAPASDNNQPRHYAETVAKAINVNISTWQIGQLL